MISKQVLFGLVVLLSYNTNVVTSYHPPKLLKVRLSVIADRNFRDLHNDKYESMINTINGIINRANEHFNQENLKLDSVIVCSRQYLHKMDGKIHIRTIGDLMRVEGYKYYWNLLQNEAYKHRGDNSDAYLFITSNKTHNRIGGNGMLGEVCSNEKKKRIAVMTFPNIEGLDGGRREKLAAKNFVKAIARLLGIKFEYDFNHFDEIYFTRCRRNGPLGVFFMDYSSANPESAADEQHTSWSSCANQHLRQSYWDDKIDCLQSKTKRDCSDDGHLLCENIPSDCAPLFKHHIVKCKLKYPGFDNIDRNPGYGTWGKLSMCKKEWYIDSFELKVEINGGSDNTALNGVRTTCKNKAGHTDGKALYSKTQKWGNWKGPKKCQNLNKFFNGYRIRNQPYQGDSDDTAVNDVTLKCSDGKDVSGGGRNAGSWTGWATCPRNSLLCGHQTKIEPVQGGGTDDFALTNLVFYCCS